MTEEEQTFIAARDDLHRLILAFTKAPQTVAYTESKRCVLERWAREHYPDLHFSAETDGPTWRATLDQGTFDFPVTLVTDAAVAEEQLLTILAEGRAYLANLGNRRPEQKE